MADMQHNIVKDMDVRDEDRVIINGRDCFEEFYLQRFKKHYITERAAMPAAAFEDIIAKAYYDFFEDNQANISHYFRNLYNILIYIDESPLTEKEKYIRIVRSQLSSFELLLLFYHAIWRAQKNRYKELIEKYKIFEDIDLDILLDPCGHTPIFQKNAYGSQDAELHFKV